MSEKNTTIETAKIALYSAIIVAFIGGGVALINTYSNYLINRVQVELPIITTQTAEAKSIAETQTFLPNISNETKLYALIIIQNLVDRGLLTTSSGGVVWEEKERQIIANGLDSILRVSTNSAPTNFILFSNVAWDSNDMEFTACGFNFRSNDLGSSYVTLLRRNGNVVLWQYLSNRLEQQISSEILQGIFKTNNDTNNLVLIVEGSRFIFLVNDTIAYDVSDYRLTTGFVGLVSGAGSNDINKCTFNDSWLWAIR